MTRPLPQMVATLALASIGLGAGCAGSPGREDAARPASSSLVEVGVTFTRDARGVQFGAEAHFARFRDGEGERAELLLGVANDAALPLDTCALVEDGAEVNRAIAATAPADVELLDAGRLLVRGPRGAAMLLPRHYPELTAEVSGVVYASDEAAPIAFEPGARYDVLGEGGEQVGPFAVSLLAPRGFPELGVPAWRRGGDLELRWAGGGEEPLLVAVTYGGASAGREVHCRVRDDGAFDVPRSLLDALPPGERVLRAEVTVTRVRRAGFVLGGLGSGVVVMGLRESVAAAIDGEPAAARGAEAPGR